MGSWIEDKKNYVNLYGGNGWRKIELCPLDFDRALDGAEREDFWSLLQKVMKYQTKEDQEWENKWGNPYL